MTEKEYICFVIMPFSKSSEIHPEKYWTNHFENFLKPEIVKISNVKVHRSEELRADIVKGIIKDLYLSDIVVADLTDHNPNVLWELGVRQSLKHGTITIVDRSEKLPFDVSTKSTLFYNSDDPNGNEKFLQNLRDAIEDCIKNPEKSDSTVLDVITPLRDEELTPKKIDFLKEEIYGAQDIKFEDYLEPNVQGFYILIGFGLIPQNNNEEIFDMNNPDDENLITSMYRNFNISSPSRNLKEFSNYIRDFRYLNGLFKAEFEYNPEIISERETFNLSEFEISNNGNIIGDIIFRTNSGYEIAKKPKYEFDNSIKVKYDSSPFIHKDTFPYLVTLFLFLVKLLYKDRFSGNLNFYLRILSTYNISTNISNYVKISNDNNLEIEKLIIYSDLSRKEEFTKIIFEILHDFLRFFGYNLVEIKMYLKIFEKPIKVYINIIFR